jgi:hypothetical protein
VPGFQSTVPAAIAALVAAFRAAPALAGVGVYDGPQVSSSAGLEVVAVGFTGERMSATGEYPEPSLPVVESQSSVEGMAVDPLREQYQVRSVIAVLNGAGDIAAARTRAYELLAACGSVLTADKTLGGTVMLATLGASSLSQQQGPRGALAMLDFTVVADAYTRRT